MPDRQIVDQKPHLPPSEDPKLDPVHSEGGGNARQARHLYQVSRTVDAAWSVRRPNSARASAPFACPSHALSRTRATREGPALPRSQQLVRPPMNQGNRQRPQAGWAGGRPTPGRCVPSTSKCRPLGTNPKSCRRSRRAGLAGTRAIGYLCEPNTQGRRLLGSPSRRHKLPRL